MSSDASLDSGFVPSSDQVLRELIDVRGRDGITYEKMRRCSAILALPAVEAERLRRRLAVTDSHIAGYKAIECAIATWPVRTDYCRILRDTLNFDCRDKDLDGRRGGLQIELHLGSKGYIRLETVAYEQFAATLVTLTHAPCGDYARADVSSISLDVRLTATPAEVAAILNLLSLERRQPIRDALAQALLDVLPNGVAVLQARAQLAARLSPSGRLRLLLRAILRLAWPPPAIERPEPLFLATSLDRLLLDAALSVESVELLTAQDENRRYRELTLYILKNLMDDYYRVKFASLEALATQVIATEQQNNWPRLLDGGGAQPLALSVDA